MSTIDTSKASAQKIAEAADDLARARDHREAETLYLLAAARASAGGSNHMHTWAKRWDRDAARQRRLGDIVAKAKVL